MVPDSAVNNPKMVVVDGFGALTELAETPDVRPPLDLPDDRVREMYEEAVLMTHWMHVLSHFLYDTRWWAEDVENPNNLPEVKEMLEDSSWILQQLIEHIEQHPDQLNHGFASLEYDHELEYPHRTRQGRLERETFSFELPGTTALPALVLNPNVPIWSDANSEIYQHVKEQFDDKEDDLRRYDVGDGTAWPIYQFSAPLVGISFMESINQSIKAAVRYFIREGDILTDDDTTESEQIDSSSPDRTGEKKIESVDNSLTEVGSNHSDLDGDAGFEPTESNAIPENESRIIRGARRLDQWVSGIQARVSAVTDWAKSHAQLILIPVFVLSLTCYGYASLNGYPDIQMLGIASLTGFIGFLTCYEYVSRWSENRMVAFLSGSLALVVITASTAVTTGLDNDVTFVASTIMQALAVISNLIVYSTPNSE